MNFFYIIFKINIILKFTIIFYFKIKKIKIYPIRSKHKIFILLQKNWRSGLVIEHKLSTCPFFYDTFLHYQVTISQHRWIQMMTIYRIDWIKMIVRPRMSTSPKVWKAEQLCDGAIHTIRSWPLEWHRKYQILELKPVVLRWRVRRSDTKTFLWWLCAVATGDWHLGIKSMSQCLFSMPAWVLVIIFLF